MLSIKEAVDSICSKCGSRDPFEIARQKRILVLYECLGTIRGFYSKANRQKFIHINRELPRELQSIVCAHELGHAVLHPNANTPFLRANTFFSVNRFEIEANKFMVCMLVSDEYLCDAFEYGYTLPQIAGNVGLPDSLIEYRVNCITN